MLESTIHLMLYVNDVTIEKEFWQKIGFIILKEETIMGYPTFDMVATKDSNLIISVFEKAFIEKVSPEVKDNVPSLLLFSSDLEKFHHTIQQVSSYQVNPISNIPFKNFSFETPSGLFIAVRETN